MKETLCWTLAVAVLLIFGLVRERARSAEMVNLRHELVIAGAKLDSARSTLRVAYLDAAEEIDRDSSIGAALERVEVAADTRRTQLGVRIAELRADDTAPEHVLLAASDSLLALAARLSAQRDQERQRADSLAASLARTKSALCQAEGLLIEARSSVRIASESAKHLDRAAFWSRLLPSVYAGAAVGVSAVDGKVFAGPAAMVGWKIQL